MPTKKRINRWKLSNVKVRSEVHILRMLENMCSSGAVTGSFDKLPKKSSSSAKLLLSPSHVLHYKICDLRGMKIHSEKHSAHVFL